MTEHKTIQLETEAVAAKSQRWTNLYLNESAKSYAVLRLLPERNAHGLAGI